MNFLEIKIFLKRMLKKLFYYLVNNLGTLPISIVIPDPYSMIPSMFLAAFIENRIEKTKYLIALGWQLLNFVIFIIFVSQSLVTKNYFVVDLGILLTPIVLAFVRAKVEKK